MDRAHAGARGQARDGAGQVYEDALHADALGKRLPGVARAGAASKPPNEEFVTFMNTIEDEEEWEDTVERLVGIYGCSSRI